MAELVAGQFECPAAVVGDLVGRAGRGDPEMHCRRAEKRDRLSVGHVVRVVDENCGPAVRSVADQRGDRVAHRIQPRCQVKRPGFRVERIVHIKPACLERPPWCVAPNDVLGAKRPGNRRQKQGEIEEPSGPRSALNTK